jgi:hypothetical protein
MEKQRPLQEERAQQKAIARAQDEELLRSEECTSLEIQQKNSLFTNLSAHHNLQQWLRSRRR